MNRRSLFLIVLALLLGILSGCTSAAGDAPEDEVEVTEEAAEDGFPVTAVDGLGNEVTIDAKPMRIVSLTLGTDEVMLDLVGPERLIGVTYLASEEATSNIADHPALAQVENVVEANPEQIISLNPDLVLVGAFTDQAVIEQLTNAGLTVFAVGSFNSVEAMQQNILTLGEVVGETAKAQEMVDEMSERLATVEAVVEGAQTEPPQVLYLSTDGWVAGSATTVDDMIIRAGGVNAAAEAGLADWNQVNEEVIIEMNPDVVIISPFVSDEEFLTKPAFAEVSAVQNERVYALSDATISATSQYIVEGVEDIAEVLYPELFGQ